MSDSLLHPRDEIVATMERVYQYGMTTTSGGNIYVREDNGDIWITPSRVDKGGLHRADIVRLSPGGARDGIHPPSSEYPFHLGIYNARPDVRADLINRGIGFGFMLGAAFGFLTFVVFAARLMS